MSSQGVVLYSSQTDGVHAQHSGITRLPCNFYGHQTLISSAYIQRSLGHLHYCRKSRRDTRSSIEMVQLVFAVGVFTLVAAEIGISLASRREQDLETSNAGTGSVVEYILSAASQLADCEPEQSSRMVSP